MSTPQHPVGRPSAAVYRRRRLMVLLILIAIVVIVVLLVVRPGSHGAANAGSAKGGTATTASSTPAPGGSASGSPAPTASHTPAPSSIPTPTAGQPCTAANVDVEALTDASRYAAGARPLLSLSITNTGATMCTIDAGTAAMVFTITSGSQQFWTSTDCQTDPVHTLIKLEPGKTLSSAPIAWDRTASSKSTCNASRPAVPAGGASYHLAVSVDGIASKTTKQFLLF